MRKVIREVARFAVVTKIHVFFFFVTRKAMFSDASLVIRGDPKAAPSLSHVNYIVLQLDEGTVTTPILSTNLCVVGAAARAEY